MSIIEREEVEVREVSAELDEVGKTLLRAAEIVRERGLAQGVFQASSGSVCAEGAVYCAEFGDWRYRDSEAVSRLRKSFGGGCIFDWNDASGRTAEEVAEALERAAYFG